MNKVKPPYNVNQASQELALEALNNINQVNGWIRETVQERERVAGILSTYPQVLKVYPSDANFILVKTTDAGAIYDTLVEQGIIVRNRSKVMLCEGCLRITIGRPEENEQLLEGIRAFGH
jgi:histidinol-phosphate aminotransferase